jgi:hypothetical protein
VRFSVLAPPKNPFAFNDPFERPKVLANFYSSETGDFKGLQSKILEIRFFPPAKRKPRAPPLLLIPQIRIFRKKFDRLFGAIKGRAAPAAASD